MAGENSDCEFGDVLQIRQSLTRQLLMAPQISMFMLNIEIEFAKLSLFCQMQFSLLFAKVYPCQSFPCAIKDDQNFLTSQ